LCKYEAAGFPSLEAALAAYCKAEGVEPGGALAIATAAYEDGDVWRFVNRNTWVIDGAALAKAGWQVQVVLNDFEAAVWGLPDLGPDAQDVLKPGREDPALPRCLIGPGTGLGLGYLVPVGGRLSCAAHPWRPYDGCGVAG